MQTEPSDLPPFSPFDMQRRRAEPFLLLPFIVVAMAFVAAAAGRGQEKPQEGRSGVQNSAASEISERAKCCERGYSDAVASREPIKKKRGRGNVMSTFEQRIERDYQSNIGSFQADSSPGNSNQKGGSAQRGSLKNFRGGGVGVRGQGRCKWRRICLRELLRGRQICR